MYYSNERTHSCHKSQGFLHDFCLNRFHLDFILSVNCWNISELFSRSLRVEIQNKKQTNKQTKKQWVFHPFIHLSFCGWIFVCLLLPIYLSIIHPPIIHPSILHPFINPSTYLSICHPFIHLLPIQSSIFFHPSIHLFISLCLTPSTCSILPFCSSFSPSICPFFHTLRILKPLSHWITWLMDYEVLLPWLLERYREILVVFFILNLSRVVVMYTLF